MKRDEIRTGTDIWSDLTRVAPGFTWRRRLGESFEAFEAAYLDPRDPPATSIRCPECGCGHRVVRWTLPRYRRVDGGERAGSPSETENKVEAPPAYIAICDGTGSCPEIPLREDEVVVYELNWSRLGRGLAKAFGFDFRDRELGFPRTRQIGAFGAAALPIVLTIQYGPDSFLDAVTHLVARLRERFVLLSPTNRFLDVAAHELLSHANAAFFDLDSRVTMSKQGVLHARQTAGELFSNLLPAQAEADENVAKQALALIAQMEPDRALKPPSVLTVFRMYCVEEMSARDMAKKCRCSKTSVLERLKAIRRATGVDPKGLRRFSPYFERVEEELREPRARGVRVEAVLR